MIGCALIPLPRKNPRAWATVDIENLRYLSAFNWYRGSDGYVVRRSPCFTKNAGSVVMMHRQIVGGDLAGLVVHHRNEDTFDNRRENLAAMTHAAHMTEHARMRRAA